MLEGVSRGTNLEHYPTARAAAMQYTHRYTSLIINAVKLAELMN